MTKEDCGAFIESKLRREKYLIRIKRGQGKSTPLYFSSRAELKPPERFNLDLTFIWNQMPISCKVKCIRGWLLRLMYNENGCCQRILSTRIQQFPVCQSRFPLRIPQSCRLYIKQRLPITSFFLIKIPAPKGFDCKVNPNPSAVLNELWFRFIYV